jgi:hypothetical protein
VAATLQWRMPILTRRLDPDAHQETWLISYGDVRVGALMRSVGNPNAATQWQWRCGFYPGSQPGECANGVAPTFDAARAAFEAAWRDYLPKRSEADFQEWRDQEAWTAEKYRRFDRHEGMPPDWRASG